MVPPEMQTMPRQSFNSLPSVPSLSAERDTHIQAHRRKIAVANRDIEVYFYANFAVSVLAGALVLYLLLLCGALCSSLCVLLVWIGCHVGFLQLMDRRWAKLESQMRVSCESFCPACRAHFSSLMAWHCRRCHTVNQDDNRHSFLWACQNCHVRPAALLCPRCKSLVMLQDGDHEGDIAAVPADTTFRDELATGALAVPNRSEPHSPTPSAVSDRIAAAIRKAKAGQL
jgi:phage FluMu protein Com